MTFYCREHPDFEGLNLGKLHDHIEQSHPEIAQGSDYKQAVANFFRDKVIMEDFRRSDGQWIARTWGRPPKLGFGLGDNEKERK